MSVGALFLGACPDSGGPTRPAPPPCPIPPAPVKKRGQRQRAGVQRNDGLTARKNIPGVGSERQNMDKYLFLLVNVNVATLTFLFTAAYTRA
jgi:hypothetical protein